MFSSIERFLLILLMVYCYLLIIALVSLFSVGKCWSLFPDSGGDKVLVTENWSLLSGEKVFTTVIMG